MDLVPKTGRQISTTDEVDTLGKLLKTYQAIHATSVDATKVDAARPPSPPLWGTHLQVRRVRDSAQWKATDLKRKELSDTSVAPSPSDSYSDSIFSCYFDELKYESSNGRPISSDRGSKKRRRTQAGEISEEHGKTSRMADRTGNFFASKRSVIPSSAAMENLGERGEGADTRGGNGMVSRLDHIQSYRSGMEWQRTQSEYSVQTSAQYSSSLPLNMGPGPVFNFLSSMDAPRRDSAQAARLQIGTAARWVKATTEGIEKQDIKDGDEALGEGKTSAEAYHQQTSRMNGGGQSGYTDDSVTDCQGRFVNLSPLDATAEAGSLQKSILNSEQLKIYNTAHHADRQDLPFISLTTCNRTPATLLDYNAQLSTTLRPLLNAYDAESLSIQSIESLIQTLRNIVDYSSNSMKSLARARVKSRLDLSSRALQGANWVAQTHLADIEDLKRSAIALRAEKQSLEIGLQEANGRLDGLVASTAEHEAERAGWVKEREMLQETNRILELKVTEKDRKADKEADKWQRQEDAMETELSELQKKCDGRDAVILEANQILWKEVKLAKEGKVAADEEIEAGKKKEKEIQANLDRVRGDLRDKTAWGVTKEIELVDRDALWKDHSAGQDRTIAAKSGLIADQARLIASLTRQAAECG